MCQELRKEVRSVHINVVSLAHGWLLKLWNLMRSPSTRVQLKKRRKHEEEHWPHEYTGQVVDTFPGLIPFYLSSVYPCARKPHCFNYYNFITLPDFFGFAHL